VQNRRVRSCVPAIAVLVALSVGCGGQPDGARQRTTDAASTPVGSGSGSLVDVGGGRSLFVKCEGSGSPTVVLEAGFGGDSSNWSAVQPGLGRTTRTCAYDRAGLGSSSSIPGVRDAGDEVEDLRRLLERAHVASPYVLVGHSYGGLLARVFAGAHPSEIAGVVLVDAMGRNQDRRMQALWRAQPPRVSRQRPKPIAEPIEGVDVAAGAGLDANVTTLGDAPLAVITHGKAGSGGGPLPPSLRRPAERLWIEMQDELAALSSKSLHVIALRSGHLVPQEQPDVVISAARAVVRAARSNASIPSCAAVFPTAPVRCRT
jgi:pimeloyl-ACP methyl ester carboxylesterase